MTTVELKTETIFIGPDEADILLKKNKRNRPLSHSRVARYAAAMREGRWHFTGDAIQQDWNEDLLNGQHRLHAVILTGVIIKVNMVTGLDPKAQRYMDQGRARNAGTQLAVEGVQNASACSAISRLYISWRAKQLASQAKSIITPPDVIVEFVHENHDELQHVVILADRVRKNVPLPSGVVGAVAFEARKLDPEATDDFNDLLASGAGLELGSPILVFRNHIIKLKTTRAQRTPIELFFLLIVTWNAWRAGRTDAQRIQLPKGGVTDAKLPEIL